MSTVVGPRMGYVAPVAPELHGRVATYANHVCRCEACCAAHRADTPAARRRARAARPVDLPERRS